MTLLRFAQCPQSSLDSARDVGFARAVHGTETMEGIEELWSPDSEDRRPGPVRGVSSRKKSLQLLESTQSLKPRMALRSHLHAI